MRRVLCKSSCRHSPSLRDPVDSRPHRLLPQPGTQLPPQGSLTLTLEILLPPMLDPLIAVHLPFSWFTSSFSQRPSFSMVFLRKGLWEVSFFNALHEWMDWSVFIVFLSWLKCLILCWKSFSFRVLKVWLPSPQASGLFSRIPGPSWFLFHPLWLSEGLLFLLRGATSQAWVSVWGSFHHSVMLSIWQVRDFCFRKLSWMVSLRIFCPLDFSLLSAVLLLFRRWVSPGLFL